MKKNSVLLVLIIVFFACKKEDLTAIKDMLTVRVNDADIYVRIEGNASTKKFILLLHGGPGSSGTQYRQGRYAEELEKNYVMIYMDQRGSGKSQGKYGKEALEMNNLVNDVVAVAQTIKHKYGQDIQLVLFGHSWGGMIGTATLLNTENQKLFDGWIEANGVHDYPSLWQDEIKMFNEIGSQQITLGNSISFWKEVQDSISRMDTADLTIQERVYLNKKSFEAEEHLITAGYITLDPNSNLHGVSFWGGNSLTTWWSGITTNNYTRMVNELHSLSYTEKLEQIKTPTLLLYSKYDFVVPPALGVSAYALIGSSSKKLVMLQYSGHSSMHNETDKFVSSINEFIDSL